MGETDFHISVILYLRQALRRFFRHSEKIYVAANMFFYYEKGKPSSVKAPDVFVVKGVETHDRRTYKLWEEKVVPCTIIEVTSPSTQLEDLAIKQGLYRYLGVQEYYLFDPLDEYLTEQLQGFRLVEGAYQPIEPDPDRSIVSQELGAILKPEGKLLRVVDPVTGEVMPTLDESMELAHAEAQRAEQEAQRADAAESEIARLRAELERLQRDKKS